jgi:hypothetical protein
MPMWTQHRPGSKKLHIFIVTLLLMHGITERVWKLLCLGFQVQDPMAILPVILKNTRSIMSLPSAGQAVIGFLCVFFPTVQLLALEWASPPRETNLDFSHLGRWSEMSLSFQSLRNYHSSTSTCLDGSTECMSLAHVELALSLKMNRLMFKSPFTTYLISYVWRHTFTCVKLGSIL